MRFGTKFQLWLTRLLASQLLVSFLPSWNAANPDVPGADLRPPGSVGCLPDNSNLGRAVCQVEFKPTQVFL